MSKSNPIHKPVAAVARVVQSRAANPVDIRVGRRLYERRTELGLTRTAVASALGIVRGQIKKYEEGRNRISPGRLDQLSELLDVNVSWFFQAEAEGSRQQNQNRDEAMQQRLLAAFRRITSRDDQMTLIELAERLAPRPSNEPGDTRR